MTIIQCDAKQQVGRLVFHGRISNIQLEQQNQHAYEMKRGKFSTAFPRLLYLTSTISLPFDVPLQIQMTTCLTPVLLRGQGQQTMSLGISTAEGGKTTVTRTARSESGWVI